MRISDVHSVAGAGHPHWRHHRLRAHRAQGRQGASEEHWWLHLYVIFSRATCVEDMLLLRPPPREFLERGPPASVREALEGLERKIAESTEAAATLCAAMGVPVPA